MSKKKPQNVIVISDDEEQGKSPNKAGVPSGLSAEGPSSSNKQAEANKKLKITVEQNQSKQNSTKVVIEIDDLPSSQECAEASKYKDTYKYFLEDYKDDSFTLEFLQLIEMCLKYECSDGMTRILKRNLIPHYKAASRGYIESVAFQKVLEDTLSNLRREPHYKFSSIKNVCEVLKKNTVKKRVEFVTLDKKVSEKRKAQYNSEVQKKRTNVEIIDVDGIASPTYISTIIDLDTFQHDVEIIEEDKENHNFMDNTTKESVEKCVSPPEHQNVLEESEEANVVPPGPQNVPEQNREPNSLPLNAHNVLKGLKIEAIEKEIERLNEIMKDYDEMEVLYDNTSSPYIMSDRIQTNILELYKKLCQLKGENPVKYKCKSIQLVVPSGQPPGPARTLEQFMNEQIRQADGEYPPFPDFVDVVKCVTKANAEDCLAWGKQRILVTAQFLFNQIGGALQERRKRREWRDLKRRAAGPARDPAEEDPALLARLEANRLLAAKRESDILDFYAQLETETKVKKKITILQRDLARQAELVQQYPQETPISNVKHETDVMLEFEVPQMIPEPQTTESIGQVETDIKPFTTPNPIDPDIEIEVSDSEDYSSSENEVSDFELDDAVPKRPEDAISTIPPVTLKSRDNEKLVDRTHIKPKTTETEETSDITKETSTVKSETDQEDETLKFLLEVDETKGEGFTIKTSIFDDEPVIFIEISSSGESESESEDEETGDVETINPDTETTTRLSCEEPIGVSFIAD